MNVELSEIEGLVLARISGEIDFAVTEQLGEDLLEAAGASQRGLVVDLTEARYLDSAGIAMLFQLARRLDVGRLRVGVCVPDTSPLWRLLKITRLEEAVVFCSALEECIEVIAGPPSVASP